MPRFAARVGWLVWSFGLAALVAAGCGGVTAAAPVSATDACMQVATALCARIDGCAPLALAVLYGDQSTCISRAVLSCTTDQSVQGIGRTTGDLTGCATALGTASCSDLLAGTLPTVCTNKPGTVVNGMACGSDLQCVSTYCNKAADCGVCSPRQAAGGDCTVDGGCLAGLVCANSRCVAPAGPGGDCNLPNQPCRTDLYCPTTTATKGGSAKCAAKVAAGGSCADSDQACDLVQGNICNPIGQTCETITVAKGGQACGLGAKALCVGFVAPCSNFLTGGVCASPAADGAACGGNDVCIPPATCVDKICRLPSAPDCH
jgi:hypothetical protein